MLLRGLCNVAERIMELSCCREGGGVLLRELLS